jgi:hypothetical protein
MRQHDPFATALRQKLDRESCRLCKSLVSDEAWRATLTLAGLPLGSDAGIALRLLPAPAAGSQPPGR